MKKNLWFLLILKLGIIIIASGGMAFEYSGYKWDDSQLPLKYRINTANRPSWLSQDTFISTVEKGFQAWNDVTCSDMEFRYDGITGNPKSRDEIHGISWNPTGAGMGDAAALTWRWLNFKGDRLYDVDMEINGSRVWSVSGEEGKYDLQSVITHEAGHFLSLGDLYEEADRGKTMYGYVYQGDISPRTLDTDDQAGICFIYPANELAILTVSLPKSLVGASYRQQLQAGGGAPPYAWQAISSTLPNGLILHRDTGIIEGTPQIEGTFSFTIQLTDTRGAVESRIFTIQTATKNQPDIFGYEIGNRVITQVVSVKDGTYTLISETTGLDQNTFPVATYVREERSGGVLKAKGWMQKTPGEARIWGVQEGEGGDFFKFSSGLLYAWHPMNVGDHYYTVSSFEVAGLPGYVFSASLTADVLSRENVATLFGDMKAYKMRHQLRIWGYNTDQTMTSYDWLAPYLGSVKYSSDTSQDSLVSFSIGGGTITPETDADGDGLKDYQELALYNTNWQDGDTDHDGLTDAEEINKGTDPTKADTDGDGLKDKWEVTYGFDPLSLNNALQDPDGDSLTNVQEHNLGTNPLLVDTDKDGLSDAEEVGMGTNPTKDDTDGDGLKDGWEVRNGFNLLLMDNALQDPDGDGLSNLAEQSLGTNPVLADTDGDGCPDGAEALGGRDPRAADPQGDVNRDCSINMADAILMSQSMAGMDTGKNVNSGADVNGDGRIGMAEVIYVLQKVAGMR